MCTVVISLAPADPVPLLLLGIRDEFTGRPWRPPARHWPGSPLIGGLDQQAGGTWLALHPGLPRVSCILNGRGQFASPDGRRSRGELPLRAAGQGHDALTELRDDRHALARYDPFHLVCADKAAVTMLSWDGRQVVFTGLEPGLHLLTNAGHVYPPGRGHPPGTGAVAGAEADAKATRFGPKFAAHRPSGDPAATIKDAWTDWLTLLAGHASQAGDASSAGHASQAGHASADPDEGAIIVRRELPGGRVWGSTSVSLVALGTHGLRYDFQPDPNDPTTWYPVGTSHP